MSTVQVRIVGTDLPLRSSHEGVHVGAQRGRVVEQLVPVTAERVVLDLELRPKGGRDAVGPHAQGKPGERFVYLVWVEGAEKTMFRRAKLLLADIPDAVWQAGLDGATIEAEVALTDPCGEPLCARIPPDALTWTVRGEADEPSG